MLLVINASTLVSLILFRLIVGQTHFSTSQHAIISLTFNDIDIECPLFKHAHYRQPCTMNLSYMKGDIYKNNQLPTKRLVELYMKTLIYLYTFHACMQLLGICGVYINSFVVKVKTMQFINDYFQTIRLCKEHQIFKICTMKSTWNESTLNLIKILVLTKTLSSMMNEFTQTPENPKPHATPLIILLFKHHAYQQLHQ